MRSSTPLQATRALRGGCNEDRTEQGIDRTRCHQSNPSNLASLLRGDAPLFQVPGPLAKPGHARGGTTPRSPISGSSPPRVERAGRRATSPNSVRRGLVAEMRWPSTQSTPLPERRPSPIEPQALCAASMGALESSRCCTSFYLPTETPSSPGHARRSGPGPRHRPRRRSSREASRCSWISSSRRCGAR